MCHILKCEFRLDIPGQNTRILVFCIKFPDTKNARLPSLRDNVFGAILLNKS